VDKRPPLRREEQIAEMLGAERIRRNVTGRVARPWQAGLAPYRRASGYDFFVLVQASEPLFFGCSFCRPCGQIRRTVAPFMTGHVLR
jgi:hypothetical protein